MKAIIFAEHDDSALELAGAAKALGADELVQVALGAAPAVSAADRVVVVPVPEGVALENAYDSLSAWICDEHAAVVVAEPTRRLKALVGKLAAVDGASAITNITALDGNEATTLYFGGVADKKVKPTSAQAYYFIGSGVAEAAAAGSPAVEEITYVEPANSIEVVERKELPKAAADLSKSDIIISCGRGFTEKDQLKMAYDLAEKIGADVACTRPLTEAVDWFPKETYIGVSGQRVKPRVYITLGVSGQMQHMVGANASGTIIAVNKDKDAPIFKQADYGIVGTIDEVVPAMTAAL